MEKTGTGTRGSSSSSSSSWLDPRTSVDTPLEWRGDYCLLSERFYYLLYLESFFHGGSDCFGRFFYGLRVALWSSCSGKSPVLFHCEFVVLACFTFKDMFCGFTCFTYLAYFIFLSRTCGSGTCD